MKKKFLIVFLTAFFLVVNFVIVAAFHQRQSLKSQAATTSSALDLQIDNPSGTTPIPTFTCLGSCPISPTIPLTDSPIHSPDNPSPTPCPTNFQSNTIKANNHRFGGGLLELIMKLIKFLQLLGGGGTLPKNPNPNPDPGPAPDPSTNPNPSNPGNPGTPANPCNTPTEAPAPTQAQEPTQVLEPTQRPAATQAPISPSAALPPSGNDPLPPGNWTLVWGDDFNGTQLDRTKWDTNSTAYNPYNGYGGPECRSNPKDHKFNYLTDGENLSFSNGILTITARREERGGQPWTSGLITSGRTSGGACGSSEPSDGYIARKGDFIIQRAKLPPEVGAWAALWTWGDGNANGEVDIYEYHSNNPKLLEISNRIAGGGCYHNMPSNISQDWHYFGAYLGANAVDFYVDGQKVCSGGPFASNGAAIIAVLDISRGTYHPIPPANVNSMQMNIDSIRVYRQQ